jgi:acetyl esterase
VTLHPQARSLLDLIASFGDPPIEEQTPKEFRALRESRQKPAVEPIHEVVEVDAGGVPARLYRPRDGEHLPLLVYLHGGGWVGGSLDSHEDVGRALANRSAALVLSLDYRLAPEHPFPAGLEDAVVGTRWAHEHAVELGADPYRIAIGGDSAGGNLAAVVAQLQAVPLVFQLLVYPVTDARFGHRSMAENAEGYFLTARGMAWFLDHYLSGGVGAPDDPRVSPLLAPDAALAGTPPALVITAGFDPLRDEGEAYALRLRDAGVPAVVTRYEGMFHGFFSLSEYLDDGKAALDEAGAALAVAFSH